MLRYMIFLFFLPALPAMAGPRIIGNGLVGPYVVQVREVQKLDY